MAYESSYEYGRKPFAADVTRGHWAAPSDFVWTCLGFAFKIDVFSFSWYFFFEMGIFGLIPYLICLAIYVVPLMVLQSYLGQFSSSGFISIFRLSPLFKGIGYIALVLNISVIAYSSIFASVPLLYLFNSFRPTLPWSCEGFKEWSHKVGEDEQLNLCNTTSLPEILEADANSTEFHIYYIPSVMFFQTHFDGLDFHYEGVDNFSMSYTLVACSLLLWGGIAAIFYYFNNTEKIGRLLRYTIWVTIVLLGICLTRFFFLPGVTTNMHNYFEFSWVNIERGLPCVPLFVMSSFAGGWGTMVSLASCNKFKTNVMRYSWFIGLGQMVIFVVFGLASFLIDRHLNELVDEHYLSYVEQHWKLFLSSGSAIASMKWPNLWSILFYTMLLLAAIIMQVTQIFSCLLSIFDEFEFLRYRRKEVTFGFIAFLAALSLIFCSSDGIVYFIALIMDSLFTQSAINLLLLIIVLWVYGRENIQRDIEFMLGQRFASWKVNMLRFVAPLAILMILIITFAISMLEHMYSTIVVEVISVIFVVIPWIFIPGYGIFMMFQTSGSLKMRFQRSCRPHDWYPVEPEDRQRYEEALGNMDITHQLSEVVEEVF